MPVPFPFAAIDGPLTSNQELGQHGDNLHHVCGVRSGHQGATASTQRIYHNDEQSTSRNEIRSEIARA